MSPSDPTVLQRLVGAIVDFLEFMEASIADDLVRQSVLADLGVNPRQAVSLQFPQERMAGIRAYRDSADPQFEAYASALDDIAALVEAVVTFVEAIAAGDDATADDYLHPLLDVMVLNYVRLRTPALYWYGQPLGFVEATISQHAAARFYTGETVHFVGKRVVVNILRRLLGLLIDPVRTVKELYADAEDADILGTEDDARVLTFATLLPVAVGTAFMSKGLLEKLDFLSEPSVELTTNTLLGLDLPPDSDTPLADQVSRRALSFGIVGTHTDPESGNQFEGTVLITLIWIPRDHGGPGLYIGLGGAEEVEAPLAGDWRYKIKLGSDQAFSVLIKGRDTTVLGPADAAGSITIENRAEAPAAPQAFPSRTGTRIEFERVAFSGEISSRGAGAKMTATNAALVIASEDGDGFVGSLLPKGETRIEFDLGLGVDTTRGVYLEGGSGMQAILPVGRSIGPVNIQTVALGLGPAPQGTDGGVRIELSSAFSARLGPVTATVDRLGLRLDLGFPEDGGNLIFADLGFGFKPPNGIGLVVDSHSLTGGGYLYFDPANARYAGIVELKYEEIAFKAVGLITTRLDDGSRGFSLLLIASAEGFTPIQLGYGFKLTGIGGLFGFNRTAKVDALRSGLRARTLDNVLFPENPVRDAPRIISNLRSVFPPQRDQFLFGPVGVIEWGAGKVLTIDIGLVLEFPSPLRLILLGQLKARFPREDQSLVRINLDFLGEINFSEATISLDAALYDSRLLNFVLTGDAALRMRFRTDPLFVLSVGGLHPGFAPPRKFPRLERIAISLSKKDNPRLRLEAYLAITAATYQYGARLELYVRASGFSVEGFLGYDVLVDWSTGQFEAAFGAAVTLKWHGRTLLGVYLDATLSGPSNLRVRGKAQFKIWRFSKSVNFDKQLGEEPPPPVPTADPLPELVAALGDPRNWAGQVSASGNTLVSFRELPSGGEVLVHPLGELEVRQQVVPLNTEITRVGGARPSGDRRFSISRVVLDNQPVVGAASVRDHFAAGQFIDMTDDERLVRPSFEPMDSGLRFGFAGVRFGGDAEPAHLAAIPIEYETVIFGSEDEPLRTVTVLDVLDLELRAIAGRGAVGRSAARNTGRAKYRVDPTAPRVRKKGFAVANVDTVSVVASPLAPRSFAGLTYTEAVEARAAYLRHHPDRRGWVQIVPDHELSGAAR
jgi:hypothetical protein